MKLRDLDAQFINDVTTKAYMRMSGDSSAGAQGILFQCPSCGVGKEQGEEDGRRFIRGAHYILVFFSNPAGATPAPADVTPLPRWTIESGRSLDDLTLSPSINCDIPDPVTQEPSSCKFHGFVRNGDVA